MAFSASQVRRLRLCTQMVTNEDGGEGKRPSTREIDDEHALVLNLGIP